MPTNSPAVRSSYLGSTLGKLADNAAAFFNGMIGKENTITGVHVEVTGGVVALGIAAYALSRPDIRNSIYQMALGLVNVQVAHHEVSEEATSKKKL